MAHVGKKMKKVSEGLDKLKIYSPLEAFKLVKEKSFAKFNETIGVNIMLGIKPDKSDQIVRGSCILPHKVKKDVKILAFAKGEQAEVARAAGAMYVGAEDLVKKIIEENWVDFDYAVATPDLMGLVGKTAKILGPLGKLPSAKNHTVATNLHHIVQELKSGLSFYKNDAGAQINFTLGKVSFELNQLQENFAVFYKSLLNSKPPAARGIFIRKVVVSSTMGPGIKVQV